MAEVIFQGRAGRQDPMFGLHEANLVDRLTADNFTTRAVVRPSDCGRQYIWISPGQTREEREAGITRYSVHAKALEGGVESYYQNFPTLEGALAYANGDDGGALSGPIIAPQDTLLTDRSAPILMYTPHPLQQAKTKIVNASDGSSLTGEMEDAFPNGPTVRLTPEQEELAVKNMQELVEAYKAGGDEAFSETFNRHLKERDLRVAALTPIPDSIVE